MKKGQFTLFIVLGFVLVLLIGLAVYVVSQNQKNEVKPSDALREIKNKDQAAAAVEECLFSLENESFYALGYHGGNVNFPYRDSFFEASPSLLSIQEMEENMQNYLEQNFASCEIVLENQKFAVEWNRRLNITVQFAEPVIITIKSPGMVYQRDTPSTNGLLRDVNIEIPVNFPELYSIVQEQYNTDEFSVIKEYEGYSINNTASTDFTEQVFEIEDLETHFIFRIAKAI